MMKKNNIGFTLAEMLIVVAIIAVLVAVLIPTLTNQLEKAREAVDMANIRSAISEIYTAVASEQTTTANGVEYKIYNGKTYYCKDVPIKQTKAGWVTSGFKNNSIYINDIVFTCTDDNIKLHGFRVKYILETDSWQISKPNKDLKAK